ncbi:MAG: ACP S-malonyltransferase [Ignavibacteria bacterium]
MSKVAFIFPGQGSQSQGMGKDLFDEFALAKEFYQKADEIMNYSLSKVCFEGTADELRQTNITQPALFVHSFIITELIKNVLQADCTAGHSLGEYTADTYAGVFSFEDGLKLVKTRGELMKRSGEIQSGTMAALIGLDEKQILKICDSVKEYGVAQPANYNCPGQIIVSGDVAAIEKAIEVAKNPPYNCRLAKKLDVSGAFHSELMKTSDPPLREALALLEFNDPQIPVYANYNGLPLTKKEQIKEALALQLVSPVRWELSVRNMIKDGVSKFIEIGSGKVLTGLIKKIEPTIETINISNVDDVKKIIS